MQDLLSKTHMEEKMARATTASIRVEKLAADAADGTADSRPDVRIETDAAVYDDGKVMLKGNPLKTTKDIICPRCHLPRLLYPTDGKGARKPDPGGIYCKKHPYIDKPGYDIYGQTWVPQGPGRGKKKKDMEKKLDEGGAEARPANVLSFPSATCIKCKRCILVTRLNNHMGGCIGNSGRSASRAAAQKISNGGNGGGGGSQDATPPASQKGTPRPGSRASSPKKRDAEHVEEDDESDSGPKKKKLKPAAPAAGAGVKLKIKPPKPGAGAGAGTVKKEKKPGSGLSVEHKAEGSPKSKGLEGVPGKKGNAKAPSPLKKGGELVAKGGLGSPVRNGRDAGGSEVGSSPPR